MFLFDQHGSNDRWRDGGDQVRKDQGSVVSCAILMEVSEELESADKAYLKMEAD
jgi:hypothetical protein